MEAVFQHALRQARRPLFVAVACWIVPLAAGITCWVGWLVSGAGMFELAGALVIVGGLAAMPAGWMCCSLARGRAATLQSNNSSRETVVDVIVAAGRLRRTSRVLDLLLPLNIPAAVVVVSAFLSWGRPTRVTLHNVTGDTLTNVTLTWGYAHAAADGALRPGSVLSKRMWVPPVHAGCLVIHFAREEKVSTIGIFPPTQDRFAPTVTAHINADGRVTANDPSWQIREFTRHR